MSNRKKVLCPVEGKSGKTYWMKIGTAFVNKDGSTNVFLDAYPANGKLHIRDLDEKDLARSEGKENSEPRQRRRNSNDQQLPF